MIRTLLIFSFVVVATGSLAQTAGAKDEPPHFEDHVRPLLKAHCFECHGEGKKLSGGLDVRLKRLLVSGGENGPAIVPGKARDSLLIEKLRSGEMPPGKKKLSADEIAHIANWIDAGAPTARAEPAKLEVGFQLTDEEQKYWFFQPIRRPDVPQVQQADLVRTPIDAFLLSRLEAVQLSFAPPADRRTLIRRASFDLLGLPPSPKEVDDFVNDDSAEAYEKLLDRLLASPHYGERWGRHWLDVAGYADSEGYTGEDQVRATAYRYRDYVIRSFQQDKPFDHFILEQLAGDELLTPPYANLPADQLDKLIATGFLRMAPDGSGVADVDLEEATNQTVADTLQIVGTSLMGLTLHCAQCHNHRYDPIPQTDYFRTRAIFEPALDVKNWRRPAAREVATFSEGKRKKVAELEAEARQIDQERVEKTRDFVKAVFEKAFADVPEDERDDVQKALKVAGSARSPEQKALLAKYKGLLVDAANVGTFDEAARKEIAALIAKAQKVRGTKPAPDNIRALTEIPGTVPETFFLHRGDPHQPGDVIPPGHLTILAKAELPPLAEKDPQRKTTGRRLAFARALTSPQHPLTSRVLVNRFWMHHFGKGIVATPGDFGQLGERPTHPELLDWLARDFIDHGWQLKRFHKQVMLSTAYHQSSQRSASAAERDLENKLLSRMPIRRLEAEIVRDAMLAVSGKLNPKPFGEPIPIRPDLSGQIVIGVDTNDGAGRPTGKVVPLNGDEFRRSLYVQVRRSKPLALLETFDGPMQNPNCECRSVTTVTPQSLMLMNSQDILDMAGFFAEFLCQQAPDNLDAQLQLAWRAAWSKEPSAQDITAARQFLDEQTKLYADKKNLPKNQDARRAALTNFCQALLSANSFLYVD